MFSKDLQLTQDAILIVDFQDRRIRSCNDAVRNVFGYQPEELLGQKTEILHVDATHHQEFGKVSEEALLNGETSRFEFEMRHKSGHVFRSQHLVSLIDSGEGEWRQVLSIVRNLEWALEREEMTRLMTDEAPIAFVITSLEDGQVLQANKACRELFKVPLDLDAGSISLADFYLERGGRQKFIAELKKKGHVTAFPLNMRKTTGEVIRVSLEARLIHYLGRPAIFAGIADVTEKERTLMLARSNESRYRDLTEMTADWFWETDPENRFTFFIQSGLLDSLPISKEWVGRHRNDLQKAIGARPNITRETEEYMIRRVPFYGLRFCFDHPRLGEIWINLSGKPLYDHAGRYLGYRGVARNVTNEVLQLREISSKEALFRSFIDHVPGTAYLKDLEGRYQMANSQLRKRVAQRSSVVIGKRAGDLFDEESARIFEEQDREVTQLAQARSFEMKSTVPGQESHVLEVTKFPVKDHTGDVVGIGGINMDITERRQLETEIEQLRRLETIGQLTGGVAHDFNNLLSAILSQAEYLEEKLSDGDWKDALSGIIEAAEQGSDLTKELLAFSRKQELRAESCDADEIASHLTSILKRTLPEGIKFSIDVKKGTSSILADARKLEAAIINLVVNSRDALAGSGTIRVAIEKAVFADDKTRSELGLMEGEFVRVSVADDGPGIPDELREKVLEPFFTTKAPGKGTGLGLSSAFGFAKQSNGALTIEDADAGAVISIYLPAGGVKSSTHAPDVPPARVSGKMNAHILVVEDNRLVRLGTCVQLTQSSFKVTEATNGDEALEILNRENGRFDMLFSDIVMPGTLNGIDLAQKARERYPHLKVILTSGYAEVDLVDNSNYPMVQKPYRRDQLLKVIHQVLNEA